MIVSWSPDPSATYVDVFQSRGKQTNKQKEKKNTMLSPYLV